MDFFMGIKGKDFVLVCTDTSAVHSIITIKQDEDKIIPVDSHKVFCVAGEAGDRVQFSEYIIANIKLYSLRNSTSLSTRSVANYARGELATALRKVGMQMLGSIHMHAAHLLSASKAQARLLATLLSVV
jgi:20S proteasome subunit beta 4